MFVLQKSTMPTSSLIIRCCFTVWVSLLLQTYVLLANSTSEVNLDLIENPDVQSLVADFHRLCPITSTCTAVTFDELPFDFSLGKGPCCEPCSCIQACSGDNKCCPDLLHSVPPASPRPKATCVYAQYRPFNNSALYRLGTPYAMISDCPRRYKNRNVREQCKKKFFQFEFPSETRDMVPVTDNATGVIYRNKFCAECNGVDSDVTIAWTVGVACEFAAQLGLMTSFEEVLDILKKEPLCNMLFFPPFALSPNFMSLNHDLTCSGGIGTCNETGLWNNYDVTMEERCQSYQSEYFNFRNIHCYLCNGFSEETIETLCPLGSFMVQYMYYAIFNTEGMDILEAYPNVTDVIWDRENIQPGESNALCSTANQYDSLTDPCRPLFCSPGMVLRQGLCEPLYSWSIWATTTISFRFVLTNSDLPVSLILSDITRLLNEMIIDKMYPAIVGLCPVTFVMKYNVSFDLWPLTRLDDTDIEYITVTAPISHRDGYKVGSTLEFMLKILELYDSDFFPGYNYSVQPFIVDTDTFGNSSRDIVIQVADGETLQGSVFESPKDNKTVAVVKTVGYCFSSQSTLTPIQFCPKIRLNSSEFVYSESNNTISVLGKELEYNPARFVFEETADQLHLILCGSMYFSLKTKASDRTGDGEQDLELHKFLTTAAFAVSGCFCLISLIVQCNQQRFQSLQGIMCACSLLSLVILHTLYIIAYMTDDDENNRRPVCEVLGPVIFLFQLVFLVCLSALVINAKWTNLVVHQNPGSSKSKCRDVPTLLVLLMSLFGIVLSFTVFSQTSYLDEQNNIETEGTGFGTIDRLCFSLSFSGSSEYYLLIPVCVVLLMTVLGFVYLSCHTTNPSNQFPVTNGNITLNTTSSVAMIRFAIVLFLGTLTFLFYCLSKLLKDDSVTYGFVAIEFVFGSSLALFFMSPYSHQNVTKIPKHKYANSDFSASIDVTSKGIEEEDNVSKISGQHL